MEFKTNETVLAKHWEALKWHIDPEEFFYPQKFKAPRGCLGHKFFVVLQDRVIETCDLWADVNDSSQTGTLGTIQDNYKSWETVLHL